MKTVRNSLSVWMLTILLSGVASNLLAQGRGNERRRENPERDTKTENRSDRDRADRSRPENNGQSKDWNRDHDRDGSRDHNRGNDRDRDNDRDHNRDNDKRDYDYGRDRDHHRNYDHGRDRHSRDYYTSRNSKYYHHGRYITYHHRHARHRWAPVYGYRYNTRYIYYRDYNLYYDCYRDVFVTWNGRFWVVTAVVPDVICHIDFGRASVVGVDYWDDDFDFYLTRRRPAYISIRAGW
jgi:hypothetical protein